MPPTPVESSADWDLLSEHSGAFIRLKRTLSGRASFALYFLTYSDSAYRDHAAQFFRGQLRADAPVVINPRTPVGTEDVFLKLGAGNQDEPAQLVGIEHWPEGLDDLLGRLNHRREALADRCRRPLLFWVPSLAIATVATRAADLWAWRQGVFDFNLPEEPHVPSLAHVHLDENRMSARNQRDRIAELQDYLTAHASWQPADIDLAIELGDLLDTVGATAQAETVYRDAEEATRTLDDPRRSAIAWGRIANMLEWRGRLDGALRIRREKEIPVFKEIGDAVKHAIARGQIAEILAKQGHIDEALRIHREEELPEYQRLNEVQLYANTQGRIADILKLRGEIEESLRIRREEQLPIYREYENDRQYAITLGHIADIHEMRGELDEALRIRMRELLPVYEGLGDTREHAITQVQIANTHLRRGRLRRAARLLEEQIPVLRRLGDAAEVAIAESQLAEILARRGDLDGALKLLQDHPGTFKRLGNVRSYAVAQAQIADVLTMRGDFDEAMRLRKEEELPIFRKLGDVRAVQLTEARIKELRATRAKKGR